MEVRIGEIPKTSALAQQRIPNASRPRDHRVATPVCHWQLAPTAIPRHLVAGHTFHSEHQIRRQIVQPSELFNGHRARTRLAVARRMVDEHESIGEIPCHPADAFIRVGEVPIAQTLAPCGQLGRAAVFVHTRGVIPVLRTRSARMGKFPFELMNFLYGKIIAPVDMEQDGGVIHVGHVPFTCERDCLIGICAALLKIANEIILPLDSLIERRIPFRRTADLDGIKRTAKVLGENQVIKRCAVGQRLDLGVRVLLADNLQSFFIPKCSSEIVCHSHIGIGRVF